jgi:hypothetical protein
MPRNWCRERKSLFNHLFNSNYYKGICFDYFEILKYLPREDTQLRILNFNKG